MLYNYIKTNIKQLMQSVYENSEFDLNMIIYTKDSN